MCFVVLVPAPHARLCCEIARVVSSAAAQSETRLLRCRYRVELSDSGRLQVAAHKGAMIGQIGATACVELRRAIESGRLRVLLTPRRKCKGASS